MDLLELNIDNTLVTDAGMSCVSSLTRLDVLSLSDTKYVCVCVCTKNLVEGGIVMYAYYTI